MRIDKFLKVSRLIKRRTIANEACDNGKIEVNGTVIKASYDVKVNDKISITLGTRTIVVLVNSINEYANKETAADCYTVIED